MDSIGSLAPTNRTARSIPRPCFVPNAQTYVEATDMLDTPTNALLKNRCFDLGTRRNAFLQLWPGCPVGEVMNLKVTLLFFLSIAPAFSAKPPALDIKSTRAMADQGNPDAQTLL